MRKLLGVLLLLACAMSAKATIIEGYTPSGSFRTVGVSNTGRLFVEISSTTPSHVVVDSGTITAFQGGAPWSVTTTGGVSITVSASTTSLVASGQASIGNVAAVIYPASAARKQGVFCNEDLTGLVLYMGDASVTTSTGKVLNSGSCYSPDVPSSFVGDIYAVSTGPTVSTSYIYH